MGPPREMLSDVCELAQSALPAIGYGDTIADTASAGNSYG